MDTDRGENATPGIRADHMNEQFDGDDAPTVNPELERLFGFAVPQAAEAEGAVVLPMVLGSKARGGTQVRKNGTGVKGDPANLTMSKEQKKIVARQRERQALVLRKAGATIDQIAAQLKVSTSGARRIVERALNRVVQHTDWDAKRLIALELQRVDVVGFEVHQLLTNKSTPPALKIQAAEQALKVIDRRAKFLNLDYPDIDTSPQGVRTARRQLGPVVKAATTEELEQMERMYAAIAEREKRAADALVGGAELGVPGGASTADAPGTVSDAVKLLAKIMGPPADIPPPPASTVSDEEYEERKRRERMMHPTAGDMNAPRTKQPRHVDPVKLFDDNGQQIDPTGGGTDGEEADPA